MPQPLPLAPETERIMSFANEEAQRLGHEYIGTEHLLMGLTTILTGPALKIITKHGLTLARIHTETMKCVQCFTGTVTVDVQLPLTPRAQKALVYADEEAYALGHMHVGSGHILLGLLREQEGIAAQVLMNLGLKLEDVRADLLADLAPKEEDRVLIGMLAIPDPNASPTDDCPGSPHDHLKIMKAMIDAPGITDEALVERFKLLVQQLRIMHACLIGAP